VYQLALGLADFAAWLIPKGGPVSLEKCIVQDADVLDYMRLFSPGDWQRRFQPEKLVFLSPHNPSLPAEPDAEAIRSQLIKEAWELIQLTDHRHREFSAANDYFDALFNVFTRHKDRFPLLAGWLL
jgi:hypothetical protein